MQKRKSSHNEIRYDYSLGPDDRIRLHLRYAQIEVRRHRAGGGNARPRCI